jgi:hypothetical protein
VRDTILDVVAAIVAQAGSASPSPTPGGRVGGIATGAGIVVLALIVVGLLVMRSRLLRR